MTSLVANEKPLTSLNMNNGPHMPGHEMITNQEYLWI